METQSRDKRRIWGWIGFDWASQPYNTLLLTFIFGPYFVSTVIADPVRGQAIWGYGVGAAGIVMAIFAPILGAMADNSGRRRPWIWLFSVMYVVGSFALWWALPGSSSAMLILTLFLVGLIGMEFATIFTNAYLPELAPRAQIGRLSGTGWAMGYVGGLITLVVMLLFLAENEDGVTLLGRAPLFGLDPGMREGTRSVGPLTAIWYAVFMVPFFLWVRDQPGVAKSDLSVGAALSRLWATIRGLRHNRSFASYLGASMMYRDALNGLYTFGGIYAAGVLGWSVVDIGIFGILAVITGAVFAWLGGFADKAFGPRPVIFFCILILIACGLMVIGVSRMSVLGMAVGAGSSLPDIAFYALGSTIGAAGGALQSASRTMLVRQADPARMTEGFGLYALAGKATAFAAPLMIGAVTAISESQQIGMVPVIGLLVLGLILLFWVRPEGSDYS